MLPACGGIAVIDPEASAAPDAAAPDAAAPDASTEDAGGVDPVAQVTCGDATCVEPEACVDDDQAGGPSCKPFPYEEQETCACAFALCDGPEDCPSGQVCYLFYPGNSQGLRCGPPPSSDAEGCPLPGNPYACHTGADCPACLSSCAPGQVEGNYPGLALDVRFCAE